MLKSVVLLLVASVSGTPIHETLPATSKLIAAKPTVLCNLGESKKLLHFTNLFLTKLFEINLNIWTVNFWFWSINKWDRCNVDQRESDVDISCHFAWWGNSKPTSNKNKTGPPKNMNKDKYFCFFVTDLQQTDFYKKKKSQNQKSYISLFISLGPPQTFILLHCIISPSAIV